jgi:hypothetical protein
MKTTVQRAVSDRPVNKAEDLLDVVNREVLPVMRDMRSAINVTTDQTFKLTTAATGAFSNIWTSDALPTNSDWFIKADIRGRAAADTVQYEIRGTFYNRAGTVGQQGSTATIYSVESAAAADVRLQAVGQTITLDVKDDGASTFYWDALITAERTHEV